MKLMESGVELNDFTVENCIHSGSIAPIDQVRYSRGAPDPGFPMAMKVTRMTPGDGAENIVCFEVEYQILPTVMGSHVPRFAAAGDLHNVPYLVMEYVHGRTIQHWLHLPQRPAVNEAVRLGVAMALAAHSLHEKNTVHLDLKPDNVLIRPDGTAVLLDFGLSCNALYPDLLAE